MVERGRDPRLRDDALHDLHPEEEPELRLDGVIERLGDGDDERPLLELQRDQLLPLGHLARHDADHVPGDVHDLVPGRRQQAVHRGHVGGHHVLRHDALLEQDRVEATAGDHLPLDRLLDLPHGDPLVSDEQRREGGHEGR